MSFKLKSGPVEGQTGTTMGQNSPAESQSKETTKKRALLTSHMKNGCYKLPRGLIGTESTVQVKIGDDVSCLLDTGSQVTTVSQSYHQQHLSTHGGGGQWPTRTLSGIH